MGVQLPGRDGVCMQVPGCHTSVEGAGAHSRCSPGLKWVYGMWMGAGVGVFGAGYWLCLWLAVLGTVMSVPGDTGWCRYSLSGPLLDSNLFCHYNTGEKGLMQAKLCLFQLQLHCFPTPGESRAEARCSGDLSPSPAPWGTHQSECQAGPH